MDSDRPIIYKYTVRPFGDVNGQHFTLITNDNTSDYYLFYFRYLDADGNEVEGTSYEFLLSILDFLNVNYKTEECDEDLFNVINYITSKNKEECEEWINYVLEYLFYDYSNDEDEENENLEEKSEE